MKNIEGFYQFQRLSLAQGRGTVYALLGSVTYKGSTKYYGEEIIVHKKYSEKTRVVWNFTFTISLKSWEKNKFSVWQWYCLAKAAIPGPNGITGEANLPTSQSPGSRKRLVNCRYILHRKITLFLKNFGWPPLVGAPTLPPQRMKTRKNSNIRVSPT